ncbi:hypothetical protein NBRC10512_006849 [Rhodotorula toruloides]|uniref:Uncharacterized protein n=1 Tax=Rhodotorula toruloides (strain NP11) TaxID=1130832 RepID=M7WLU8_RHOT1|nr:uncharacterized protein RHTO_01542 [Rhodotorula toruloides NP11]EMS21482.1 hypothetical protein RHTO_01542 [Rhodotorula toruloides NP11]
MSRQPDFRREVWEKAASKDDLRALFLYSTHSPAGPFPTQHDVLQAISAIEGATEYRTVTFDRAIAAVRRVVENDWDLLVPTLWENTLRGCEAAAALLRQGQPILAAVKVRLSYDSSGPVLTREEQPIRMQALMGLPPREGSQGTTHLTTFPVTPAGEQAFRRLHQTAVDCGHYPVLCERWELSRPARTKSRLSRLSEPSREAVCQLAEYLIHLEPTPSPEELPTLNQLLAYAEISARYLDLRQHLSSIVDLYQHHERSLTYASRWASKIERTLPFVDFAKVTAASSTEALSRVRMLVLSIDANAPPFPSDLPSATALFGTDILLQADLHRAHHQGDLRRISHRMARRIGTTKEAWEAQRATGMF